MPPKTKKQSPTPTLDTATADAPSFEASLSQLAEIVEQLESGELPLEDALRLFERGIGLVQTSQHILDHAEKRVEQLLGFDKHGQPMTAAIDAEDDFE